MKRSNLQIAALTVIAVAVLAAGCGGGGETAPPVPSIGLWTWMSGANTSGQSGIYGTKGIADPVNVPGGRYGSVSWKDSSGNLWLFGGAGYDSSGLKGSLNDLWKFDGSNWTWIGGTNTINQKGTYGIKGTAAPANMPGGRDGAVSWTDGSGNLWLFSGYGLDAAGSGGYLNDLWKYDGTNWTWVSGANMAYQPGTYGTKGVAAGTNMPGARYKAISWIGKDGNLWLFGGVSRPYDGSSHYLNDLWKFDGTNWTWVSGSNAENQLGNYGTKGVASSSNVPGARYGSVSWVDKSGNLWLFGGECIMAFNNVGSSNDLWKFDGTNWTWIGGSNAAGQAGTYGTRGIAASANVPGARSDAVSWVDGSGNFWLFGGQGIGVESSGSLNDLWKFDGSYWTWMSGSNSAGLPGTYGTKGVADAENVPGSRTNSVGWSDSSGNLWLFGGSHLYLNDLWRFEP